MGCALSCQIDDDGRLGADMFGLLADLHPEVRSETTVLQTELIDHAALHGVLGRVRDRGLSIQGVSFGQAD